MSDHDRRGAIEQPDSQGDYSRLDFEVLLAEIPRKLDECLRVCCQKQARKAAFIKGKILEMGEILKRLESING